MIIFDEPQLVYEVPIDEFNAWKEAHGFRGAVANSVCEKILMAMNYPHETFAEASARLGYGNTDDERTKQWYYDHGIYLLTDYEIKTSTKEN